MRWVKKPIAAQMKRAQTNMTYVVDGNKCANIVPQGQYFQLINSTIAGRSDGVYTASKAIPANEVIDNTYFNQTSPIAEGAINKINSELVTLNSKIFPQVDNIDSFISLFQSQNDFAVRNVRIVSGTLSTLLYGNNHSGGCTGYRVGSEYIIYSAIDSDGLFYTGWVTIAQKTATFSRMGYKVVSFTKSVTIPDSGTVDIDINAETGGINPVGALVKLTNNYPLPYFGPNNTHTFVELLNANILRIKNGVSGWGTATVYITLFFA